MPYFHFSYPFAEKPLPPEDFKCVSENWSNLNCTWREPENPVRTSYVLSFIQPGKLGRYGRIRTYLFVYVSQF